MWKVFVYSGKQRLAYIPPEGPAFQVIVDGEFDQGFRSFKPEKMVEIATADHLFDMIPEEILEKYPLLEMAK